MVATEPPALGVIAFDRETDVGTLTSSESLLTTDDDLAVFVVRGPSSKRQVACSKICILYCSTGHVLPLSSAVPLNAGGSSGTSLACGSGDIVLGRSS